jgi:hypothetical protein
MLLLLHLVAAVEVAKHTRVLQQARVAAVEVVAAVAAVREGAGSCLLATYGPFLLGSRSLCRLGRCLSKWVVVLLHQGQLAWATAAAVAYSRVG